MIQINSLVQSKNPVGEVRCPGRVVALLEADYFVAKMCHPGMNPDAVWSCVHASWRSKPVVLVTFMEPHRTATFEEWVRQGTPKLAAPDYWTEDEWRADYEQNCPRRTEMCFPYDDLEEIDA